MRFQALMPDVLHWLGITKIDRMLRFVGLFAALSSISRFVLDLLDML